MKDEILIINVIKIIAWSNFWLITFSGKLEILQIIQIIYTVEFEIFFLCNRFVYRNNLKMKDWQGEILIINVIN